MNTMELRLLYGKLHSFPPRAEIFGGTVMFFAGAGLTIGLWEAGWIAGITFMMMGGGLVGIVLGRTRAKELKELDRQVAILMEREADLVGRISEMTRAKQPPFRWLDEQGINDIRIRSYLLKQAESRKA